MKTPHVKIDSVERVLMDNANKLEALKSRYAARKERLKQDRTLNDEGEQATEEQGRSATP